VSSQIIDQIGIDPFFYLVVIAILLLLVLVLLLRQGMQYRRMKANLAAFMRGKSGKNLEAALIEKFKEIDEVASITHKNVKDIKELYRNQVAFFQKIGIVKYDAFLEMGGKLSFALTLLDQKDDGFIINVMHSREGCYTYVKEVVKGECYVELSKEEKDALERAVLQEAYAIEKN